MSRCHWFQEGGYRRADAASEHVPPSGAFTVNRFGIDPWFLKNIVRTCLALLAGIIAGGRAVSAFKSFKLYHAMTMTDPSRAEPYLTVAAYDLGILVLSVTIAGLVWWLLRPSSASGATKRN